MSPIDGNKEEEKKILKNQSKKKWNNFNDSKRKY